MAVLHVGARGLMYVTCEVQSRDMGHGPPDTWEARIGGAEDERGTSTGIHGARAKTEEQLPTCHLAVQLLVRAHARHVAISGCVSAWVRGYAQ